MRHIDWNGERIGTGVIKFGDELPGLFIWGGDCIGISTAIQKLLETLGTDTLQRNPILLESLVILNELREAIERDNLINEIIKHATKGNGRQVNLRCLDL